MIAGQLRDVMFWALESARDRGVWRTLTIAASNVEDALFDWRFGTETSHVVNTDELEDSLLNRPHAVRYRPSLARPFRDLLRKLRLPEGSTFVDVGSGKGRILMLAAQHPFKRVVGIEFSPALWLIYSVPAYAAVLDASNLFVLQDVIRIGGNDVYIYQTAGRSHIFCRVTES